MAQMAASKRPPKTSRAQYELYLNELRTSQNFRENKFTASDPNSLDKQWEMLCSKLNSCGGGAKSIAGWKRVFSDWKCHVRAKARINRNICLETGNRGPPIKPLTDIEEQLLSLTGEVVIEGFKAVDEFGLDQPDDEPDDERENEPEGEPILKNKVNLMETKTPQRPKVNIKSKYTSSEASSSKRKRPRSLVGRKYCLPNSMNQTKMNQTIKKS